MKKKLYRVKSQDTLLGGVTQGLALYFNVDVTLIRVLFVILFFTPAPVFIAYLILWIVLPEEERFMADTADTTYFSNLNQTEPMSEQKGSKKNLLFGLLLIIVGVSLSFQNFFDIDIFRYLGKLWPLALVGIGVWFIVRDDKDVTPN